jgi:hypothetical protein
MQKGIYKYYTELPTYAKGVVVIGITGAAIFLGYKLYKKLSPSQSEIDAAKLINNVTNDIDKFKAQNLVQTFPDANYNTFANTIYEGMRYAVGDDYKTVVATCKKMQNALDVALLIKAFGTKQNYVFGIEAGTPMDMLTFVKLELGNEWWFGDKVKDINDNWTAKGIPYRI